MGDRDLIPSLHISLGPLLTHAATKWRRLSSLHALVTLISLCQKLSLFVMDHIMHPVYHSGSSALYILVCDDPPPCGTADTLQSMGISCELFADRCFGVKLVRDSPRSAATVWGSWIHVEVQAVLREAMLRGSHFNVSGDMPPVHCQTHVTTLRKSKVLFHHQV